ncbi:HVO_0476 family zinc finger protein [Candidatus Methanomassiliicoccus intestinalis]|uniref:HVO_0476 family zinc finger protein n=1 Tax=Candidatus Methanomassiliicoccus intestinalis TaxID=1406512 RepID=UPI0011D21F77|nr:HVO_0476 family zinc finger protein [Candidatus Methanomassiliicoccus intestinalis]
MDCPSCGENAVHEVLRGKMGKKQDTLEATVKCQECGHTYTTVVREPESLKIPIIVSDRSESHREEIELMEDEILSVGDEIFLGESQLLVTAIESKGKRVENCEPANIDTIWAKKFDHVIVKISINKHTQTIPAELEALPDEEFYVGDLMTIGTEKVAIHSIKTASGMVRRGSAEARDIVRIYAKAVRTTYS